MSYLLGHSAPPEPELDDTVKRHAVDFDGRRVYMTDKQRAEWLQAKAEAAEAARARVDAADAQRKADAEAKQQAHLEAATAADDAALKRSARVALGHLTDAEFDRRWPAIRDQLQTDAGAAEVKRRQQEAIAQMRRKF